MPTISCATCSKPFTVPPCRVKLGAKFCSMECRNNRPKAPSEIDGRCKVCDKDFSRSKRSKIPAYFCSHSCYEKNKKLTGEKNTTCSQCGKGFWLKPSSRSAQRKYGFFCSYACHGKFKSTRNLGDKNPNWRGKGVDSDGYRVYVPQAHHGGGLKRMKLHQAVCCEILGVDKIPRGLHVHHRDCDVLNNAPENLAILNASDHKWIHKQFGVATLWAFMRGKLSSKEMSSWSDDCDRASRILNTCIIEQTADDLGITSNLGQEKSA